MSQLGDEENVYYNMVIPIDAYHHVTIRYSGLE